jgi:type I restriction enzyme S subunit
MNREFRIKDFLKRIKNQIIIEDDVLYKRVTVSGNHKGVKKRDELIGSLIRTKKQFTIKARDFILSKIDARNGAFGIIPDELDNAIITGNFWTYSVDTSLIDTEWFFYFTHSYNFIQICIESSTGSTHRKYLDEKVFLNHKIVLPEIKEQKEMVKIYKSSSKISEKLSTEIQTQKQLLTKLKQSTLQEAIQGKLTVDWRKENPNTEPASELLKRIKAKKAQLIKDKKIKKEKPLPPITQEEIPFELPDGWAWCRLGDTLDLLSDYHANGSYKILKKNVELFDKPDYAIILRTTNFHKRNKTKYKYISHHAYDFLKKSKVFEGDIIMNKIADPGKVFYVEDRGKPMSLAMNLFLLRINNCCNKQFLYYYLHSSYKYIYSFTGGATTKTITKDAVKELLFPIPPFLEQKEIVKKVEALMQQCQALEQEIKTSEANAKMLMQAVLKEAFESKENKPIKM